MLIIRLTIMCFIILYKLIFNNYKYNYFILQLYLLILVLPLTRLREKLALPGKY